MALAKHNRTSAQINRRSFWSAAAAVPVAGLIHTQVTGPMLEAVVAAPSKQERMQALTDELLAMVRDEFPEGVRIDLKIADNGSLSASGLAREWSPDERLRNGGMWVERNAGYLELDDGKMVRQMRA